MKKGKDILIQEEEFLQLNAEIDSKTEDLMNQMNQIKKMQSENEKLYTNWSSTDKGAKVEHETQPRTSTKEENYLDLRARKTYSENVFSQRESLPAIKDEELVEEPEERFNFLKLIQSNHKHMEVNFGKDNSRRNLKGSLSGRVAASIVGPQESDLSLGISRYKSDVKIKNRKVDDEVIPETMNPSNFDGVMKFLSTKIRLLSEQLQAMLLSEKKHLEKIKELQNHKEKSIEERDKLLLQTTVSKSMLVKYEKQIESITAQMQSTQTENSHLKKELESLRRELRNNVKSSSLNEIKLSRTQEEFEKLKFIIQKMRHEEKEFKETQKQKTEGLTSTVKCLDRQRAELLHGFKKQLLVIDKMKKQKGLMDAAKFLQSTQDDIINYLDRNLPDPVSIQ